MCVCARACACVGLNMFNWAVWNDVGNAWFWGHDDETCWRLKGSCWSSVKSTCLRAVSRVRCFLRWQNCLSLMPCKTPPSKHVSSPKCTFHEPKNRLMGILHFSDPPTFPIKLALYPTISPLNHDFHWFCTTIIWWWVSQRIKEHIEKYSPIKILINAAIWHHYGKSQFLVREPSNWMVPIFPMLNCPCRAHDR